MAPGSWIRPNLGGLRRYGKCWSQLRELGPEVLDQAVAELHLATMRVLRQSRLLRLEILKESIGFANRPHYLVRSR